MNLKLTDEQKAEIYRRIPLVLEQIHVIDQLEVFKHKKKGFFL